LANQISIVHLHVVFVLVASWTELLPNYPVFYRLYGALLYCY